MAIAVDHDRYFVVTGGPGSGKTALIDALAARGRARTVEAGRAIIRDQVAIGGPALPWSDPRAFAELMLCWEMRSWHMAAGAEGPVIFDRGIGDVVGYLRLTGLAVPAHVEQAARHFRYNRRIFVAPPWADIFRQDEERKQSFVEAEATFRAMVEVYSSLGYDLLFLPLAPVSRRVAFVEEHIAEVR